MGRYEVLTAKGETRQSLNWLWWIGIIASFVYFCMHLKINSYCFMIGMVVISQIMVEVCGLKLLPSIPKFFIHAFCHFVIIFAVIYISELTDILSLVFAGLHYLCAILISTNLYADKSKSKPSNKTE